MNIQILLRNYLFYTAVVVSFGTLVSCKSTPPQSPAVEQAAPRTSYTEESEGAAITRAAANEIKAHSFIEIKFNPGSNNLTSAYKAEIDKLIREAGEAGKIGTVLIMSWADEELPSQNLKRLPETQLRLADNRNQVVRNYLQDNRIIRVESYNMAEQPNTFSKWFNTTDSKLKKALVEAGLPTTADEPRYPSKASHTVVMVRLK